MNSLDERIIECISRCPTGFHALRKTLGVSADELDKSLFELRQKRKVVFTKSLAMWHMSNDVPASGRMIATADDLFGPRYLCMTDIMLEGEHCGNHDCNEYPCVPR